MNYTLCHGAIPVCELIFDEDYHIEQIGAIFDRDRMPVGLRGAKKPASYDFTVWFFSRGIPARRDGLEFILEKEGAETVGELIVKNKGLSLCDHYWVKPDGDTSEWKDVNFFDNAFGKAGENIYIGEYEEEVDDGITPNSLSSGMLPKKWIIKDGIRCLVKGSETMFEEEPYNEKAASVFFDKLPVEHVPYGLSIYKGKPYSVCPSMLQKDEELIAACYVVREEKRDKAAGYYEHYIRCCGELGVKGDIRSGLEKMITLDYLIANTDRHWSNFGVIRNAKTLEAARLAPLYDQGAAFYTKLTTSGITAKNRILKCRSFKHLQHDNLKLVKNTEWLDVSAVRELPGIVRDVLGRNSQLPKSRLDAITGAITERIRFFEAEREITILPKTRGIKTGSKKR
jgi:hypothetical protein